MQAKHATKTLALILALAMALLGVLPVFAATPAEDALTAVLNYLDGKKASLSFGNETDQSDWKAFALARGGKTLPAAYLASAVSAVKADNFSQSTDYARTVLVLTAMGYDASNFMGVNLLAPLLDLAYVTQNLPNGPTFALLALNSGDYDVPASYDLALVDTLLDEFDAGRGWGSSGPMAPAGMDIDANAMALQALTPYYGITEVEAKVDAALALLADEQFPAGGFGSDWGGGWHAVDSCSTAQVIIALSALGLDAANHFTQDTLSALLAFQEADGGFDAAWGENPFADSQAACALLAYHLFLAGDSLFDMSDAALAVYVDKAGLNARTTALQGTTKGNYTDASWAAFEAALTTAQTVAAKATATQAEVNSALSGLNTAFSGLTLQPTPSRLEQWEAKLPVWLGFIKSLPDWIEWVIYYVFFGWTWDVIY